MTSPATTVEAPRLRRSLTLWDLIMYGIIVIQPTAPMPAYGVFSNAGQGHVVWTDGEGISKRWLGLHLCGPRAPSFTRICHRMEHDDGLHPQSADLHDMVRQGDGGSIEWNAISDSISGADMAIVFRRIVYRAEPARRPDFGAD